MAEIRNAFLRCREVLLDRLKEAAPGRIQLLTGPRQVGKTTLLLEIAAQFADRAVCRLRDRDLQQAKFSGQRHRALGS